MQKGEITRITLGLLAAAGIITALAIAPGLGAALKLIDQNPRKAMRKLNRALQSLADSGKVSRTASGYRLTAKGQRELIRHAFVRYQFPEHAEWDKKWRVICFDIPEDRKYVRHVIHQKLIEIGFYRFQDSVYITPHRCDEILGLIQQTFFLKKQVRGMVVTELDDEKALLAHFKLRR